MKLLVAFALAAAVLSLRWLPASWFDGAGAFGITCVGVVMVLAAFVSLGAGLGDLRIWLRDKMR